MRFYDRRDAEDAMDSLDGRQYDGRDLRIQMAKYARPEPSRQGFGTNIEQVLLCAAPEFKWGIRIVSFFFLRREKSLCWIQG